VTLILFTLLMEAIRFFETLVLIRSTRHNIPEDDILHNHTVKSSNHFRASTGLTL
jgi:hypothetical protein